MSRYFCLSLPLLCLLIISCSSDDDISPNNPESAYELQSIDWRFNEENPEELISVELPEFYFKNESDSILPVSINPLEYLKGSSRFIFNDSLAFAEFNYPVHEISAPMDTFFLESTYARVQGRIQPVILQQETFNFAFSSNSSSTTEIPPNNELRAIYTLAMKKVYADFLITYKDANTGAIKTFDGVWEGYFYNNNTQVEFAMNEIE